MQPHVTRSVFSILPRLAYRMRRGVGAGTALLLFLLVLGQPAHATDFLSFAIVRVPPPNFNTMVHGINDAGQVVGGYQGPSITGGGFLFDGTTYTTIAPFGSTNVVATGINDAGQIVGSYRLPGDIGHGFVFDGTTFATFDAPGDSTVPYDINDAGQIVGNYNTRTNFFWDGASFTTLNAAPGTNFTTDANGINDAGQIVGTIHGNSPQGQSEFHGYVYDGTTYTTFDAPGRLGTTEAFGINDAGQIVGTVFDDSLYMRVGFVKDGTTYTEIVAPGASYTSVVGINDVGEIIGSFSQGQFIATPVLVPEPSTGLLVMTGLLGLAYQQRRHGRAANGTRA